MMYRTAMGFDTDTIAPSSCLYDYKSSSSQEYKQIKDK